MLNKPLSGFYKIITLVVLLLALPAHRLFAQFYNGSQMTFGKNRVQYDNFFWQYYRFDKYDIYFYTGGKELAMYTAKTIPAHIKEFEKLFDYQMSDRIQVLIYNKHSHFKQSNIGLGGDEQYNIGGVTRLVGSKVFVYYDGDHAALDRHIRAGIAEILLNDMMYGGNWRESIKNSTLLALPDWYINGLISYAVDPDNPEVANRIKDGVLSGRFNKFNRLTGDEAAYAGHAMWQYIANTYGKKVLPNILYMTRISRNIESGFLFVLGTSLKTLTQEWNKYYYSLFRSDNDQTKLPLETKLPLKTKKARIYSELKVSPDGRYAAFATNEMGQQKVWIYDTQQKKLKRLRKWNHKMERINDDTYPLLGWHPTGQFLSMIMEEKGEMILYYYSPEDETLEKRQIFNIEEVLDFGYSDDGKQMVFSAVTNGYTDLYLYNIGANTQQRLTNDIYDDLDPRFINNSTEIIFSSNRPDDTLRFNKDPQHELHSKNRDIFIYPLNKKDPVLKRITNTPAIDETQPMPYVENKYVYLADKNGVRNRYVALYDSVISFIDTTTHYRYFTRTAQLTDYSRNILEHEFNPRTAKYSEIIFNKGRYNLFTSSINPDLSQLNFETPSGAAKAKKTPVPQIPNNNDTIAATGPEQPAPVKNEAADSNLVDINNYQFEFQKTVKDTTPKVQVKQPLLADTIVAAAKDTLTTPFKFPELRNYNLTYFPDKLVTQMDLSYLNAAYQPFMGAYANPGAGAQIRLSATDLFEDKRITGVIRPSANFSNNQYMLIYEDKINRLDKQYVFHRQSFLLSDGFSAFKILTHEGKYILKWPFSEVASLRGTANFRYDRFIPLSTSEAFLRLRNFNDYWTNLKLEYVFDNTISKGLNLYNGTRYKFFAEQYKQLVPVTGINGRKEKAANMTVVGFDVRHYQKIHRDFIWAGRIAASTSLGRNKLIYYMGGVDSWLTPKFNYATPIDFSQNYRYQTLATNMRGFIQNARNGRSFAVINSELRLPLFRYLMNKPIKSDFINNFQVIGFGDLGTAWNGATPYSENNILNTKVIETNNVKITLQTQKEPVIAGYGFGLRSRIMGYFVRADWAWGVEDYEVLPRVFYLSLSLDF